MREGPGRVQKIVVMIRVNKKRRPMRKIVKRQKNYRDDMMFHLDSVGVSCTIILLISAPGGVFSCDMHREIAIRMKLE